jgi:hypothetical protein
MLKRQLLLSFILALAFTSPSYARGGSHGGGFHGGGFHGGGFHGGGFRGGVFFGFHSFGFGGFGPYYPYAPYSYGYAYPSYPYLYSYPSPYASTYVPPTATLPPPPQASPAEAAANVWYFCPSSKGYYPYVTTCSVAWKQVPTTPPSARTPH